MATHVLLITNSHAKLNISASQYRKLPTEVMIIPPPKSYEWLIKGVTGLAQQCGHPLSWYKLIILRCAIIQFVLECWYYVLIWQKIGLGEDLISLFLYHNFTKKSYDTWPLGEWQIKGRFLYPFLRISEVFRNNTKNMCLENFEVLLKILILLHSYFSYLSSIYLSLSKKYLPANFENTILNYFC